MAISAGSMRFKQGVQMRLERPPELGSPTAPGVLPLVDGYRGLAALGVVVYHAAYATGVFSEPVVGGVLARLGNYAVAVFFVISGLVLYLPFATAALRRQSPPDWRSFYWRRFLRIFPAYWVALSALFFAFGVSRPGNLDTLVANYTLTQTLRGSFVLSGMVVAWTLAIEIAFYLALPALAHLVRRFGRATRMRPDVRVQVIGLGLLYLGALGYRLVVLAVAPNSVALLWLPAYLDWFALGMLLAVGVSFVSIGGRLPRPAARLAESPFVCVAAAVLLYWALVALDLPRGLQIEPPRLTMVRFLLSGLSATLLVLPAALGDPERGLFPAVMSSPPLRITGRISYGIYLWHTLWLYQVVQWVSRGSYAAGFVPVLAAILLLSLPSAAVSYLLVELPARDLRFLVPDRARGAPPMTMAWP